MLFITTTTTAIIQSISFCSFVLLFSGLQGILNPTLAVGKYKWDRVYVNKKTDCHVGGKCCVPFLNHKGKDPLEVPDGAYVTADIRYTDTDGGWDPPEGSVTVEHYHPSDKSTKYYFRMDREYAGHYYNQIHWKAGEIDNNGSRLAVCVLQKDSLLQGRTTYTLITYTDINLGRA